ncbi:MAG: hypothetical protein H3C62_09180 [Gemmatimonadaceae bacterium]|nr:hypothetical protein [Gemmatimonadaceae bacterium]
MTTRVRPFVPQPVRPASLDGLCGHWALAYVTGRSLARVIADLGHQRPMALREIVAELARAGIAPRVVHHDTLREEGRELWYAHGEDQFLAVCCALDLEDESRVGHALVLHGRRLYDPAAPELVRRVTDAILAEFACAIICSLGRP